MKMRMNSLLSSLLVALLLLLNALTTQSKSPNSQSLSNDGIGNDTLKLVILVNCPFNTLLFKVVISLFLYLLVIHRYIVMVTDHPFNAILVIRTETKVIGRMAGGS